MNAADAAWAAGLFDGEGAVSIHREGRGGYWVLSAQVQMCSEGCVERLGVLFGGRTFARRTLTSGGKQAYVWYAPAGIAVPFFERILPHMHNERQIARAELALEFQRGKVRGGAKRPPEYHERQATLATALRSL